MDKSPRRTIGSFFIRNLVLVLSIYSLIVALLTLLRCFPVGTIGMLLVPVLIASTIRWKLKGGLISAILASIIVTLCHILLGSLLEWKYLSRSIPTGIIGYFLIVIAVGYTLKRVENQKLQLREAERRYEDLYNEFRRYLDLVQVMIVALDRDGNVTYVNNKTSEILGYKEEEIIGKNWFENFIPKRINGEVKEVFKKVITGELEAVEYYENPVLTKDGRERLIAWHNTLLYDDTGNIAGSLSAGEDVTEIRNLERQNQERLKNLGILYDAARDLITEDLDVYKRAQVATRICVEDLGADLAWIGYKESDGRIKFIAQYPPDHSYTKDLTVRWDETPLGQSPVGRSIRTGIPQIVEDTANDHRLEPWRDRILKYNFRTIGAFPLTSKNNIFGAIILYSKQPSYFTLELKDLVYTLAHLTASALENSRLFENIQRDLGRIRSLHTIDTSISESLDLKVILNTALNETILQLNVDAVAVFLYRPSINALEYVYGKGFNTRLIEGATIRLGESLVGLSALERRTVKVLNLQDFLMDFNVRVYSENIKRGLEEFVRGEGFISYYGVPLISKGQLLGVLEVFNRSPLEEDKDWEQFLEVLAKQIAIGIDNARLFRSLEESNIRLINAYEETIEGWAYVLDLRDRETEGHSQRVADLTVKIAEKLGINSEELVHIRRGALLHDIGKIAIPDSILLKPDKLTEEEWEIMRKHPIHAFHILSRIEYLRPAIDIPYCHHERWDGSGYPRGLKGEEIPLSARIFAVADVFDALTSNRPYRKAWKREEAISYIKEQSGKQFDPKVVKVFLELLEETER
ncbi:MAG: GAF domain-containing protein [bacterium]|nr:GAF domain-containing protein [bacterium]